MLKLRFKNSGSLQANAKYPQERSTIQTNEESKPTATIFAQTDPSMHEGSQQSKREKKLTEKLRESEQRFRAALACEQKARAEAEARASRLEAIFEAIADGMFVYDSGGHLLRTNAAARELLALDQQPDYTSHSPNEHAFQHLPRDEHGQPLPEEQWPLFRVLNGEVLKGATSVDLQMRSLDDRELRINASGAPVRDSRESIIGGVIIFRDETERRRLEQRMDEFLGIVSHELRTPLTAIKGNIQLAQLQLKKVAEKVGSVEDITCKLESAQGLLERADRQIRMQNRLVNDLLDVSRIQADKLELRLEPCNLLDIVREAIRDQHQASPMRTISLELACEETVPVIVDIDRIGQVVTNYLTNALKYSEFDRPVEVSLQSDGHVTFVSVRDEGPGLSEIEQQRIWERFYRAEGIEVQSGTGIGLGLGLHICKTIIEYHQGQVGVQSVPGQGSTFWFTLPVQG